MKRTQFFKRLLSFVMVFAMLAVYAVPANAAKTNVRVEKVDNDSVSSTLLTAWEEKETNQPTYADTDMVRVSIMLEEESTVQAGFSTENIAQNADAAAYRDALKAKQQELTAAIEAVTGDSLDVVWNLTLAANLISANVEYGQIAKIAQVDGVEKVVLENRYDPQESVKDATDKPNMAVSSEMTGSNIAWQAGLTGAGQRIAIIDTGLDLDHQSVDPKALEEALRQNAADKGVSYDAYVESLDLLDTEEIAAVLPKLNVAERYPNATAEQIYQNLKAPFGYNYIDNSFYLTHDEDQMSEHGSHVAGISAANRLLNQDGTYVDAAETVGVVGNAPDAQIIVMKVFGKAGGAYDSDYMAAIEDAIILGCDSANLSLGSGSAGMVKSADYQDILDGLAQTNTVVVISAGNNSYWAENADHIGLPYVDAPNFHTGGSPGTYENSFCVASVENDGGVGNVFRVADNAFMYSETDYSNKKLITLDTSADGSGVTLDYVFIDGNGTKEDYADIDIDGKVVFCSRGAISFSEKGNNASELGAAATIIYNNAPGTMNMDLTDYKYTEPCICITQSAGQQIKADSTAVTSGSTTYYTGKMTVSNKMAIVNNHSDYLTMSAFSSWGVPGDLSMKPEITAPGGNIYSINGALPQTDEYELMSGTSMAAPQVSGITALVMQAIQENNLAQAGLSNRALAQSLMMSTAVPMICADSECYYPVIQQGAGLINTAAAVSADSYVTVVGMADGKVKAELGDDADRTGTYSFAFNLNNLTDTEKAYQLSADLFTQAPVVYYPNSDAAQADDQSNLAVFMDKNTVFLDSSNTQWLVNGEPIGEAAADSALDLNQDGVVDYEDAKVILDYVVDNIDEVPEAADVNGDGEITSYDAHLLLSECSKSNVITVPADGSAQVTVTMNLTAEDKEVLDVYFTNGAYIQAYVFADAVADAEGALGTSHSIPVLAYYGDWADAAMFDIGSQAEYAAGAEVRTPYLLDPNANSFAITYQNDPSSAYYFGGNPLVPDDAYLTERNAMNANDTLAQLSFTAIRNAGASRLIVVNNDTNEVLAQQDLSEVTGTFYSPQNQNWASTSYTLDLGLTPSALAEGTNFTVALQLASEYFVAEDGTVDWDALGDAATFDVTAVIDNTAPVLGDVVLNEAENTLNVTASDNQYVAAAVLFNAAGTQALSVAGAKQDIAAGETAEYVLDLSNVNGKQFLLQVADYAMNITTYKIDFQIGEIPPMPEMIAFDLAQNAWVTPSMEAAPDAVHSTAAHSFTAATIVDHMVLAAEENGTLYVMPEYDLSFETPVAYLNTVVLDMAYNAADDLVYALDMNGNLITIDRFDGAVEMVGELGLMTNTLACTADGTFYCNKFNSGEIYSFTLDTLAAPELVATVKVNGAELKSAYLQTMEISPNNDNLYWASCNGQNVYLIELNTATGAYTVGADQGVQLSSLLLAEKTAGDGWGEPTDEVTGVQIAAEHVTVLRGGNAHLSALVQPWNAADRSVSWTSDNEEVAVVNAAGVVTGVGVGDATITAVSNADPSVTASCTVTVETLDVTFKGMLQDSDGAPVLFNWNMAESADWSAVSEMDTSFVSGTYAAMDDVYYVIDDTDANSVHKLDVNGKNLDTQANGAGVPLWDMAYSPVFSQPGKPMVTSIYGYFLLSPMDPMNLQTSAFDLSDLCQFMFGIASFGADTTDVDGQKVDAEHVAMVDESGNIIHFWMYPTEEGMSANVDILPSDLQHKFSVYENKFAFSSMVVGNDGNLYLSAFDGQTNVLYRLTLSEDQSSYHADKIGTFGKEIWPAVLTEATANESAAPALTASENAFRMDAVQISAEELAAVQMPEADTRAAFGSLNAVTVTERAADAELMGVEAMDHNGYVTIDITADQLTTNGVYSMTYDPEVFAYADCQAMVPATSVRDDGKTVTLAYADADALAAGTVVGRIILECRSYHVDTTVEMKELECNESTAEKALPAVDASYDNCPSEKFEDFKPGRWYHEAVDYVVFNDFMKGINDTEFGVNEELTRAQLVTILYRVANEPGYTGDTTFPDVCEDCYYRDAACWAEGAGIVLGTAEGKFNPNGAVSRAELVTMIYRFAKYSGLNVSARADLSAFTDSDQVPGYAAEAMQWAVAVELVKGTTDTTLAPRETTTRVQVASVIYDYCTKIA